MANPKSTWTRTVETPPRPVSRDWDRDALPPYRVGRVFSGDTVYHTIEWLDVPLPIKATTTPPLASSKRRHEP